MEFFGMDDIADTPTKNRPNYAFMAIEEHKQKYFQETFDKFIHEYVLGDNDTDQSEPRDEGAHTDCWCNSCRQHQELRQKYSSIFFCVGGL